MVVWPLLGLPGPPSPPRSPHPLWWLLARGQLSVPKMSPAPCHFQAFASAELARPSLTPRTATFFQSTSFQRSSFSKAFPIVPNSWQLVPVISSLSLFSATALLIFHSYNSPICKVQNSVVSQLYIQNIFIESRNITTINFTIFSSSQREVLSPFVLTPRFPPAPPDLSPRKPLISFLFL